MDGSYIPALGMDRGSWLSLGFVGVQVPNACAQGWVHLGDAEVPVPACLPVQSCPLSALRYFGFITKHPADHRFACHVFVSEESTKPLAESVG